LYEEKAIKKSKVSIARGTDPEKMLHDVLAPLGGIKKLIRPGTTVVLKPNAGPMKQKTLGASQVSLKCSMDRNATNREIRSDSPGC